MGTNWIGRRTELRSGELVLHSKAGSGSARVDAQLVIDRGQMRVDRAGTDHQLFSDLSIGEPLGHQAQHLHLSGRQSSRIAVRLGTLSYPGLVSEELRHHHRLWDCQRLL